MASVVRLPPELWCEITALACVDGGFTGRSLALACKFFHAQSLCYRFHSLAFDSVLRMEAFLSFLRLQPEDCHPRIKHLYIFHREAVATPSGRPFTDPPTRSAPREANVMEKRALWDKRFRMAASALLVVAAPHLSTLCIVAETPLDCPLASPCRFPKLEELSCKGVVFSPDPGSPASIFPTLKRVHFISPDTNAMIAMLASMLPSITHLRISNIDYYDANLAASLGTFLGSSAEHSQETPSPPPSKSLPRLGRIILHGTPPAPCGWSGFYGREWAVVMTQLEVFAQEQNRTRGGARVLLLKRPMGAGRWLRRMRDQWIDRMQGGRGCWVESDAQEAASEVKWDVPMCYEIPHARPAR
ncbi:hypothetical protein BC628DRAFT_1309523 [Trametes gibbosa]|nr:hypothetical protein BC628DRAFT_1309523 [Trametes gibbosa]